MEKHHKKQLFAPAKLNLSLRIRDRLPNSYHSLETVMVPLSFGDDVALQVTTAPKSGAWRLPLLTCESQWDTSAWKLSSEPILEEVPRNEENLALKAARALLSHDVVRETLDQLEVVSVHIQIKKRIPMGGGLAGGSTNAAAVLRGLAQILELERIPGWNSLTSKIGAGLGADIPFCLAARPSICTGIGEVIEPLPWDQEWSSKKVLLVYPGQKVDTQWAYRTWDERNPYPVKRPPLEYRNLSRILAEGCNDFEALVFENQATWKRLCEACLELGAEWSHMTGSGSVLASVWSNQQDLETINEDIRRLFPQEFQSVGWYTIVTGGLETAF